MVVVTLCRQCNAPIHDNSFVTRIAQTTNALWNLWKRVRALYWNLRWSRSLALHAFEDSFKSFVKPSCTVDTLHHVSLAISTPISYHCYMEKLEVWMTLMEQQFTTKKIHICTDGEWIDTFVFWCSSINSQLAVVLGARASSLVTSSRIDGEDFLWRFLPHFYFRTRRFVGDLTSSIVSIVVEPCLW